MDLVHRGEMLMCQRLRLRTQNRVRLRGGAAQGRYCRISRLSKLVITWDWSILRCRVVSQVEEHLIRVTPAPALGRIITLDDQMARRMVMSGCMTTGRLIATTNMSAASTDSKVNPYAAGFQTLFAAARARRDRPYGAEMRAAFIHT